MGDPPTDLAAAGLQKIRRSVELLRRTGYRFSDEAIAAMRARKRLLKPSMDVRSLVNDQNGVSPPQVGISTGVAEVYDAMAMVSQAKGTTVMAAIKSGICSEPTGLGFVHPISHTATAKLGA
nr:hypothetical protein Iba_chr05aCG9540 [Ipomoea batatas]GMC95715.1 hypothetical protein Iba_chr05cCG11240 [Ipomoea batatas]GMC95903.1 hypothetical protein Iba_chr05cCG13030 [Ipomoea batatas]